MMNDLVLDIPSTYLKIEEKTNQVGFSMSSDKFIGSLLKTLSASKPTGNFLEIGTGTGLALAWVVDGMDTNSKIISIDNDPKLLEVAVEAFQGDNRVQLVCAYGEQWLEQYNGEKFDLIFADSWPGKYCAVHKTLNLLKSGGFYVIDDMFPQAGWLDGHQQKAETLIDYLENREDIYLTKLDWSTGIIIATKI